MTEEDLTVGGGASPVRPKEPPGSRKVEVVQIELPEFTALLLQTPV